MADPIKQLMVDSFGGIPGIKPLGPSRSDWINPPTVIWKSCPPDDPNYVAVAALIRNSDPDAWTAAVADLVERFRGAVAAMKADPKAFRPLSSPGIDGYPSCEHITVDGIPARLIAAYSMMDQGWIVAIDAWRETAADPEKAVRYKYERML